MKFVFFLFLSVLFFGSIPLANKFSTLESYYTLFFLSMLVSAFPFFYICRYLYENDYTITGAQISHQPYIRERALLSPVVSLFTLGVISSGFWGIYMNGALDTSVPVLHVSKVLKVEKVEKILAKKVTFNTRIYFKSPSNENDSIYLDFPDYAFSDYTYNLERAKDTPSEISLRVHEGFFGFSWYSDVEIYPEERREVS